MQSRRDQQNNVTETGPLCKRICLVKLRFVTSKRILILKKLEAQITLNWQGVNLFMEVTDVAFQDFVVTKYFHTIWTGEA